MAVEKQEALEVRAAELEKAAQEGQGLSHAAEEAPRRSFFFFFLKKNCIFRIGSQ